MPTSNSRQSVRSNFQPIRDSKSSNKILNTIDDTYGHKDISDFTQVELGQKKQSRANAGMISSAHGSQR